MGAWSKLRRFAHLNNLGKQQDMEQPFLIIWTNDNLFNFYQGHLRWNLVPRKDFFTRKFYNWLLNFNGDNTTTQFHDFNSSQQVPQPSLVASLTHA
jgi:hypothetical protein